MARLSSAQRRQQLIHVATTVFAKYGYDGTTTAALAEAAGITEPLLYRHFAGKRELFAAIVEDLLQQLEARWEGNLAVSDDPIEQARAATQQYFNVLTQKPECYRVLNSAILTSQDPAVLGLIRRYYDRMAEKIIAIIKPGQERGVFRTDLHADALACMLIDLGIGYALQEAGLWPGRMKPEMFATAILSVLNG